MHSSHKPSILAPFQMLFIRLSQPSKIIAMDLQQLLLTLLTKVALQLHNPSLSMPKMASFSEENTTMSEVALIYNAKERPFTLSPPRFKLT